MTPLALKLKARREYRISIWKVWKVLKKYWNKVHFNNFSVNGDTLGLLNKLATIAKLESRQSKHSVHFHQEYVRHALFFPLQD